MMLTMANEEIRFNVRTTAEIKRKLEIAAQLRGLTVTGLINSLAVRTIREEEALYPDKFILSEPTNRLAPHSKKTMPHVKSQATEKKQRRA